MSPNEYPKRILLAITGLSPQVVAETLYALTQTQQTPFVPTHVIVISTAEGAERARLELLSPDIEVSLTPVPLALYTALAVRAVNGDGEAAWDEPSFKQHFLNSLGHIVAEASGTYENAEQAIQDYAEDYFAPHRTRINTVLKQYFGPKGAAPYQIRSVGRRGAKRYGLVLRPEQITLSAALSQDIDLAVTRA
jgi:hypothetical protein